MFLLSFWHIRILILNIFTIHNAFIFHNMFILGIKSHNEEGPIDRREGAMYNYDSLWRTMKERGVTTYSLVNHYNISSHTMSNIRHNENITVETLHRLCQILHCQASDIVEITFDEGEDIIYKEVKRKEGG